MSHDDNRKTRPPVGTKLKNTRGGSVRCEATVVRDGIRYNNHVYPTLSAAAKAASKDLGLFHKTCDGPAFWGLKKKRAGRPQSRDAAVPDKKDTRAVPFSLQGSPPHQKVQNRLAELGYLRRLWPKSGDHDIGGGFHPDVLWFVQDPERDMKARATAVFEIERRGREGIIKSLTSLETAHNRWNCSSFLLVPESNKQLAQKLVEASFYNVPIRLLSIEDVNKSTDDRKLLDLLGLHPTQV